MSPSHAIILHIVNLPGSSFKEAVAKQSNLSVQRHFILKALYYLQVIGFVYIPSCYPWFMVKYKNTCTQPFVSGKILWHSMQRFPVTLEHMFQYNVGLEATFWTSSQCDGDRGMLRHTHVCVIVLLWRKWPNVIGNEYASHDCYHLAFFKQLNVLPYWNIEES